MRVGSPILNVEEIALGNWSEGDSWISQATRHLRMVNLRKLQQTRAQPWHSVKWM